MRPAAVRALALVLTLTAAALADDADPAARPADLRFLSKDAIERPVERSIAARSDVAATSADAANPKVRPGLVRWHPDLGAALAASKLSGRPVLVFQLLGLLDDEFC